MSACQHKAVFKLHQLSILCSGHWFKHIFQNNLKLRIFLFWRLWNCINQTKKIVHENVIVNNRERFRERLWKGTIGKLLRPWPLFDEALLSGSGLHVRWLQSCIGNRGSIYVCMYVVYRTSWNVNFKIHKTSKLNLN